MAFTESEILEFLNYAKDNGAAKTCRRFNVSLSSVRRWNAHYKIYQKQTPRVFSDDEKRAALKYAAKFGMSQNIQSDARALNSISHETIS